MSQDGYLTLTEFAKIVGVTRRAVAFAVSKGKLTTHTIDGKPMVEGPLAQKEWAHNIDHVASKKGKTPKKTQTDYKNPVEDPPPKDGPDTFQGLTLADAERQDKVYKSRLSELKYLEQAGKLVELDKVQREAFELGRKTRDAIMGIPARVVHDWAAETDPHKLELKINQELINVLDSLS